MVASEILPVRTVQFPRKMAICVTFHFDEDRLRYIKQTSDHFGSLAAEVLVIIVTNAARDKDLAKIERVISAKGFKYSFFVPTGLGHPFLLTWSHLSVFQKLYTDPSITHFMYLEDDILISEENIRYWTEGREQLRQHNLFPSFLRVELKESDSCWYSVDCLSRMSFGELPKIRVSEKLSFINIRYPYQGMYLYDRELMSEHLAGPSSNPDFGIWGIRERAAQGLTFVNVPKGFTSRNVIPYDIGIDQIARTCFIHHVPNNYVNSDDPGNKFGRIPVGRVINQRSNLLDVLRSFNKLH
jgi:hypothetical protein